MLNNFTERVQDAFGDARALLINIIVLFIRTNTEDRLLTVSHPTFSDAVH